MELQWPLILFTTLLAWSAGLFATQGYYALKGEATKAQLPAWITSAVLLVAGGIAVFFHLQHWERIFNGFGQINSGITQELIAIVLLAIVAVIFLVFLRKADENTSIPIWVSVLLIVLSAVLVIVMAHSYMMASRPAWNSFLWIVLVVGNACAFGPATIAVISDAVGDVPAKTGLLVLIGAIINAIGTVAYSIAMEMSAGAFHQVQYYVDPTDPSASLIDPSTALSAFSGESAIFVWIALIVGALIPVILGIWRAKSTANWTVLGVIITLCVLVGAIAIRVVFYMMGTSVFMLF